MTEVILNKKQKNPFEGMDNTLALLTNDTIDKHLLNEAYNEVDTEEKKKLFYSVLFSIGDITNRHHNIFKTKNIDNGGKADRENFYVIMNWLRDNYYEQFKKFLFAGLFDEYTCFDHLFRNRLVTYPGTTQIKAEYNMFSNPTYRKDLAEYVVSIIKGNNPFKKMLVAKFLTNPRLGKRSGHTQQLPQAYRLMLEKAGFIKEVSDLMGWKYKLTFGYSNFWDFRKWKQQYNGNLESVLFSTGKIKEFDESEFKNWLNTLPSGARFRVKNRVLYSFNVKKDPTSGRKWSKQATWFEEWEAFKEKAQEEQRVLAEKVRQGTASDEDKLRLVEVTKEAKVTTGATSFKQLYEDICNNDIDWLKLESFLNKVHLDYNMLTILDDSGSMRGAPINFAKFLTTIMMAKNPDDSIRNLLITFSTHCHIYSIIDKESNGVNNWWTRPEVKSIPAQPFIIPEKSFKENYTRVSSFINAVFSNGGTHLNSVSEKFANIAKDDPETADIIKQYPIWCILSDGDINNERNAVESIRDFQKEMERTFGFCPFLILIDVVSGYRRIENRNYSSLKNFIYIPGDPNMIEQVLTNFKDIDVFDVYAPLTSIYRSNRYELVRENVI